MRVLRVSQNSARLRRKRYERGKKGKLLFSEELPGLYMDQNILKQCRCQAFDAILMSSFAS